MPRKSHINTFTTTNDDHLHFRVFGARPGNVALYVMRRPQEAVDLATRLLNWAAETRSRRQMNRADKKYQKVVAQQARRAARRAP